MVVYSLPIAFGSPASLPEFLLRALAGIARPMPAHLHDLLCALYLIVCVPALAAADTRLVRYTSPSRRAQAGGGRSRRPPPALSKATRRAFILRAIFGLLVALGQLVEIVLGIFVTPTYNSQPAHPRTWIPLYILLGKMERAPTFLA
jgi:hypothetical protein